MTIYSEKQNQILENQCEALQVQETYLSTCEPNSCASLPSEKRFGGLLQAGLGSQAAGHSTTPLYHALGHQSGLSQCFPVSKEGGCEGKRSYKVTFMDQEDVMCGSIWGMIGFLSQKQISAFKHQ